MWSGNPVKLANKILAYGKVIEGSHRTQRQGVELDLPHTGNLSVVTFHFSLRQYDCSFLLHFCFIL